MPLWWKLYSLAFVISVNCLIQVAQAEGFNEEEESDTNVERTIPDRVHRAVGGGIRGSAHRIDRFFFDKSIEEELQTTSLRLKPTLRWNKGGDVNFEVPFRFLLVLPGLQEKWHVFLNNVLDEDNDLDPDTVDTTDNDPKDDEDDPTSSFLGLQHVSLSKVRQHLRFRAGVKFRIGDINPFVSTRYRYTYIFSAWLVRWTQKAYWFQDTGFGERTDLAWERKLGEQMQFRSTSSAIWSEASEGVDLKQLLMLRQFLQKNKAVSLSYQITGHTRPEAVVDAHTVAVKYRQQFWREWLFFEIEPQLRFFEVNDYEASPVLFASSEVVF